MTKENRKILYNHFVSKGMMKEAAEVVKGTNEAEEFSKKEEVKEVKSAGKK
jgi:hypothetical protein